VKTKVEFLSVVELLISPKLSFWMLLL